MMKALFYTLGCKVNQYETETMRKYLTENGYETDDWIPGHVIDFSGVIIINSCTVTAESDRKQRQLLRRCRRENPHAVIVLTGCMPQAFPEIAEHLPEADIVLGNAARSSLLRHIHTYLTMGQRIVSIIPHDSKFEPMHIDTFSGHTRCFVKIEDGCNRFCSYCIIPYARGRVRSKPLADLRAELESLAANGYHEIVLVGINLTAYGQAEGYTIADAVETACAIDPIRRIRLGSLEPDMLTDDIIRRFAIYKQKLCPQFHLSLQSGCDATLKRMNRHYTTQEYRNVCQKLREIFPDCALTTDVMVGYPGEDENEFDASLSFVRSIGFAKVHVFPYSRRPGTPAAKAYNQVSAAEKAARSHKMSEVCATESERYMRSFIGRTLEVLLENRTDGGWSEGFSSNYLPVRIRQSNAAAGTILSVRITDCSDGFLIGLPCSAK